MRGESVPLWSLWWWNKRSFQSPWGCYCFLSSSRNSPTCWVAGHSLWHWLDFLMHFVISEYPSWVVSAFPSPYLQGAKWGPTWGGWLLHCHRQTPCFQMQSQEVWASFHPLCLERETALDPWLCRGSLAPALTPRGHVWSPFLMGGIRLGLVSHLPLRPLPTAATFCPSS